MEVKELHGDVTRAETISIASRQVGGHSLALQAKISSHLLVLSALHINADHCFVRV